MSPRPERDPTRQAIAIGLSKARRVGLGIPPRPGAKKERTRRQSKTVDQTLSLGRWFSCCRLAVKLLAFVRRS